MTVAMATSVPCVLLVSEDPAAYRIKTVAANAMLPAPRYIYEVEIRDTGR